MRTSLATIPLFLTVLTAAIWMTASIGDIQLRWFAGINLLVCGMGLIRSITGGFRPVSTVFHVFTLSWLGVAPIVQISTGTVAWSDISVFDDKSVVLAALSTIIAASLAFMTGAEIARYREKRWLLRTNTATVRTPAFLVVLMGVLILSPYSIAANGGLSVLFTSRAEAGEARAARGLSFEEISGPHYAIIHTLPSALAISGTLIAIYLIRRRIAASRRCTAWHIMALCISSVALIVFANPFTHSRFTAATAIGAVVLSIWRPRSKQWAYLCSGVLLILTLFIYPLANAFRSDSSKVRTGTSAFTGPDFDGFQQVVNTIEFVSDHGHTWGNQILSGLAFFVPRSLWESKAEPASYSIAAEAGYTWTNLSLPIHIEFYLEFGWAGVAIGMFLFGLVAGHMDIAWLKAPNSRLGIIAPYFALATLGIVRGPIGAQIPVWGATFLIIFVCLRVHAPNIRQRRLAGSPGLDRSKRDVPR